MARPDSPAAGEPRIAVVVCTADRPESLARTLDTLWSQSRRPDELIVVDDGRLAEPAVARFAERAAAADIAWRYFAKPGPGLTGSRNVAARLAQSEVLLYLDDDVSADSGLVGEVAALMRDPRIAAVAATVLEPTWSSVGARALQWAYRAAGWWAIRPAGRPEPPPPAVLKDAGRATIARFLSGAAMAVRRDVVLACPFDETLTGYALGEDRDLAYRLAPRHWLVAASRARVVHRRDPTGRGGDARRFGEMAAYNYLHILRKSCSLNFVHAFRLMLTFAALIGLHLGGAVARRSRRHWDTAAGLIRGLVAVLARPRHRVAGRRGDGPIRVALVTNRLEHGGAEWMMLTLARSIRRYGVEPHMVCLKDAGPLAEPCRAERIAVHDGLLRHKYDAGAIGRLARLYAREQIEVVMPVGSGGDRMFWATLAARLRRLPVVVWSHWCPTADQTRFERSNRMLYGLVDRFVALGERHRAALARWERVPAARIEVIRNGIDAARFNRGRDRAAARAALGLGPSDVAIAIVANLRREKRHDVFIAAAAEVARSHPQARFLIIGDGPERPAVEAAVRARGLSPPVLRMLGARDDVPALLAGIDVVALCSDLECFSLTMLEAAAAGCAFVGPDSGSLDEFLRDGATGLLVPPAQAGPLAAALRRLLDDAGLRERLAEAAARTVRSEFEMERTAWRFAMLLHSLAGGVAADVGRLWGPEPAPDPAGRSDRRLLVAVDN